MIEALVLAPPDEARGRGDRLAEEATRRSADADGRERRVSA